MPVHSRLAGDIHHLPARAGPAAVGIIAVAALADAATRVTEEFVAAMGDASNFGLAKSLFSAASADGVDLGDPDGLQSWIAEFNARPEGARAHSRGTCSRGRAPDESVATSGALRGDGRTTQGQQSDRADRVDEAGCEALSKAWSVGAHQRSADAALTVAYWAVISIVCRHPTRCREPGAER